MNANDCCRECRLTHSCEHWELIVMEDSVSHLVTMGAAGTSPLK